MMIPPRTAVAIHIVSASLLKRNKAIGETPGVVFLLIPAFTLLQIREMLAQEKLYHGLLPCEPDLVLLDMMWEKGCLVKRKKERSGKLQAGQLDTKSLEEDLEQIIIWSVCKPLENNVVISRSQLGFVENKLC